MIADALFYLFAASAVVSALFVITRKNPVASVLFLIVTFFSLSGMFVLLDAHFIAAVQVIVYAGAIMVLFLFVVMLLNLGHLESEDFRGAFGRFLAGTFAAAFVALLARPIMESVAGAVVPALGTEAGPVPEPGLAAALESEGAVGALALPLFRDYLIPFEITSLLLLVAIVGAVVLARRRAE
jgi:NADH-quinone oxidoreductase subunit J